MLIKSDVHTVGATTKVRVKYHEWLENTAFVEPGSTVVSSDTNYVISAVLAQGKDITFLVSGGSLNLPVTITVTMVDSLGNVLPDTIALVGVAP